MGRKTGRSQKFREPRIGQNRRPGSRRHSVGKSRAAVHPSLFRLPRRRDTRAAKPVRPLAHHHRRPHGALLQLESAGRHRPAKTRPHQIRGPPPTRSPGDRNLLELLRRPRVRRRFHGGKRRVASRLGPLRPLQRVSLAAFSGRQRAGASRIPPARTRTPRRGAEKRRHHQHRILRPALRLQNRNRAPIARVPDQARQQERPTARCRVQARKRRHPSLQREPSQRHSRGAHPRPGENPPHRGSRGAPLRARRRGRLPLVFPRCARCGNPGATAQTRLIAARITASGSAPGNQC